MTPSTLVRARLPLSFIGCSAAALEKEVASFKVQVSRPRCVASLDDGRPCGLPARYIDFQRGGHVCFEHRPAKRKELVGA